MSKPVTKVLLAACSIQGALMLAMGWILLHRVPAEIDQGLLDDPRVRDRVVSALVDKVGGAYDSHNDPEVARVLLKNLRGRSHGPIEIDTNRFGLRERDYVIPKPEGTVRIVLLGDSFVFGTGCPQDERLGRHLEDFLRERSGNERIEVLHFGIMSWNIVAECSFLRRQLSLVQPDLVVHVTVPNDLDDMEGVRGFGGLSRFCPTHRDRADGTVRLQHPSLIMDSVGVRANTLIHNRGWESTSRFAEARRAIGRLVHELDRRGARYLHVFRWPGMNGSIRQVLGGDLADPQVAYVADAFTEDRDNWAQPDDMHWGPRGMRAMALMCYGLVQQRNLLPGLGLSRWDEADRAVERIHLAGEEEPSQPAVRDSPLDEVFDFSSWSAAECAHVNGGVNAGGVTMPFASLTLRNPSGQRLRVRGLALERPEMDGATVRVSVDGVEVGSFPLTAGAEIDETLALPTEVSDRSDLTVWLQSDDWVYDGEDLQQCVVMRLLSVAIEP